jgi:hypothetical protein
MIHNLNENQLPQGFSLLDIGEPLKKTNINNIYTSSIQTSDLFCNYCEYQEGFLTLCIKLVRDSPPRVELFNFITESEAYSKSLIGEHSTSYFIEEWFPAHILFLIPLENCSNPHRLANFITTGLQVRLEATINQGELITLNALKKEKARQLKAARQI